MRIARRSWSLVVVAALAGCLGRTDTLPRADQALPALELREVQRDPPPDSDPPPLRLGPGDLLDVQTGSGVAARERCRITVDGMLYYGPGDGIAAAGRTIDEVAGDLSQDLARWYRDASIAVVPSAISSRYVLVLGRVAHPGAVALTGGERVLDLIAAAGGLSPGRSSNNSEEVADLTGALFLRDQTVLAIDFVALLQGKAPAHNVRVHPGDYLYIPSGQSREVNVLGAVVAPRTVPYRDGLSVARALAEAGGYTRDAYLDRVVVVRGSTAHPVAGLVDVRAIIEGRRPDVALAPRDIVYVPGRTSENPRLLFDLGNRAFVTSVAGRYASDVYDRLIFDRVGAAADAVKP